jgi:AcrR family transcriptional regulator
MDAARALFVQRGYLATTMSAIAKQAGIALDTVYATVGKKPTLFRLLVEGAISGAQGPIPAEQRDYVRAIRAEPDAARKLRIYAKALCTIHPRLAPLLRVLQVAAPADADLAALWKEISERRAANMRTLSENLLATGQVRDDLSAQQLADIIWSTGSPEFFVLLVGERGWSLKDFEQWLGGTWTALLLRDASTEKSR